MAADKLVDSIQLDANLVAIANAIRTKGGTSAQLSFPSGMVDAINAIPEGGGGEYNVVSIDNGDGTQDIQITDAEGALSVVPLSVTTNDTYTAPSGQAYSPVTVNVPQGVFPSGNKELTPSETEQTDIDVSHFSTASVNAIPSDYIGRDVRRLSTNMGTASIILPSWYAEIGVCPARSDRNAPCVTITPSQRVWLEKDTLVALAFPDASVFGNASPEDVALGKTFTSESGLLETGTMNIQRFYTGSTAPTAAQGNDGDIYLKVVT